MAGNEVPQLNFAKKLEINCDIEESPRFISPTNNNERNVQNLPN